MKFPARGRPLAAMPGPLRLRAHALMLVLVALGALLAAPAAAQATGSLYASNWAQGAVSTFSIGVAGLLTQQGTGITSTGSQPAGLAVSPNGQEVYVANENQGTVSTFSIGSGGALTQVGAPVASGNTSAGVNSEPYGVAVSPNGLSLYVANYQSGTVSTFSIGTDGALTQQGTGITTGSPGPGWLAVSPNGQNLYVTNYGAGTVSAFSIGSGGALTPEGTPLSTGSGNSSEPENLAVSPNGGDLYVANHVDGTVTTFSIGVGGALTRQGIPVLSGGSITSGPEGLAISPDGQELFVTNETVGTVSTFSIGAGGALTPQTSTGSLSGTTSSSQPFGVAVSPNGQELYVASFAIGTVSTFGIGAGGALTPQGAAVFSGLGTGSGAYELATSPDQGPTAAYSATVSPTKPQSTFSAGTSTAGSTPIATYAWQFGDGTTATGAQVSHTFAKPGTYTVTLTLTDSDLCSASGPYTGQSPYCTIDPAASTTQTITVPARASASHESITGIAKGKPKLAFTIKTGTLAPALGTIAVSLPSGLSFSSRRRTLARHITVTGPSGKRDAYSAKVRHGVLTITLRSTLTSAHVTISSPELSAGKRLVNKLKPAKGRKRGKRRKRHKPVSLAFRLGLTDTDHDVMSVLLRANAS